MSMPLYAWAAYIHKAPTYQNSDTLRMAVAATVPHMEKADRARTISELQGPLVLEAPEMTKEEYIAQLSMAGIGVELN